MMQPERGWWTSTAASAEVYAEIDRLLDTGYTTAAIARGMGLAEKTIRTHRRRTRGAVRNRPYGDKHWVKPIAGTPLTRRELQILARLFDVDEPTQERAARDLGMSVSGLRDALRRAFAKLAVHTLLGAYRVLVTEQDRRMPNWRVPSK
jgi:DNA-binding CsgD family transcriptional regulator